MRAGRRGLGTALIAGLLFACADEPSSEPPSDTVVRQDALAALWSFYKFHYLDDGRVVSLDEDRITTSEGQGYALLRAVWSDDRETFERVLAWTNEHLQVRGDRLFAWKWKERVLDEHAATDADTDVALALLLASRRFGAPHFREQARAIAADIWRREVLVSGDACYATAGDWARDERFPVIHVGYLAPYAYDSFAELDPEHDWHCVRDTAYTILRWLYFDEQVALPPERVYLDRERGALQLEDPRTGRVGEFGYDAFPIFWRVALDARWRWNREGELRARMLAPLRAQLERDGKLVDRAGVDGTPRSALEALPLYATVHALAEVEDPTLAARLRREKLDDLWENALAGRDTPYYLHNWLAFDETLSLGAALRFDELFGFLGPFDRSAFVAHFPFVSFGLCLLLFPFARWLTAPRARRFAQIGFLAAALWVCFRYLGWRGLHSLNFVEGAGPLISVTLWLAELYCFGSVLLLIAQLGLRGPAVRRRPDAPGFAPSVDVLIPIFREPLEILERTLIAARALRHDRLELHVLDDGHRDEVRALAARHGARYHLGPRQHAKAGNLNQALARTGGELIAVFDTDHVPVTSFLEETVPHFHDPRVGFVQTPHHFRNADVFQHAFGAAGRVPNEQDMFNHGIQARRDAWGGAFFVGSGAVFRRTALEGIGGFRLMSITEDVHTSQHLHAAGWQSVFVDRDLAVGLAAENLAAHIVQRRRWMLGCLQIFFRDNPLLCRGLGLRQRVGYFASLYHFFYPLARVVFWLTPLYYLYFHWHPILSEVAVLSALLLPYLVVLPLIPAVLLPDWSRPFWGPFYESAISAPLARSIFDLLLPRSLGFQVTPKGLVTQVRRFDWRSSRWTLALVVASALGMLKGLYEVSHYGIERDAYFFNLSWTGYNLVFLLGALALAWERPQRRRDERVRRALPARLRLAGQELAATTHELGLAGCSLALAEPAVLPAELELEFVLPAGPLARVRLRAGLVYHERVAGRERIGLRFLELPDEARRALLLGVFAEASTWQDAHAHEARGQLAAAGAFVAALARAIREPRPTRRRHPRRRRLALLRRRGPGATRAFWLHDEAPHGIGLRCVGERPREGGVWQVELAPGVRRRARARYVRPRFGFFWQLGLAWIDEASGAGPAEPVEHALAP